MGKLDDTPPLLGLGGSVVPKMLEPEAASASDQLFLLTNTGNLLEILSSGVAKPAFAYRKYYRDLSETANGRIPLLPSPFHPGLVETAVSDGGNLEPVAIELSTEAIEGWGAIGLLPNGETWEGQLQGRPPQALVAVAGVIPVAAFKSIHFASEDGLSQFRRMHFANISEMLPVEVSAGLFSGGNEPPDWNEWLGSLDAEIGISREEVLAADAAIGGMGLLAALQPRRRSALEAWIAYAESVVAPAVKRRNATRNTPTERAVAGALAVAKLLCRDQELEDDFALSLLKASVTQLMCCDVVEGFQAPELMGRITSMVVKGRRQNYAKQLAAIQSSLESVLSATRDLRTAVGELPGAVTQALFLVLTQRTPHALAKSISEGGLKLVQGARSLAALACGLLYGWALIPTELRGGKSFELYAGRAVHVCAMGQAAVPRCSAHVPNMALEVQEDGEDAAWVLREDKAELIRIPVDSRELLASADMPADVRHQLMVELSIELGWNDCMSYSLDIGRGAKINIDTSSAEKVTMLITGSPVQFTRSVLPEALSEHMGRERPPTGLVIELLRKFEVFAGD